MLDVAHDLLGCVVRHRTPGGTVGVRLTEVEAYAGETDGASHAFRGPTARNATMFGPPGHAYVYFTYGMHYCMNLVCGPAGSARAVLLRAGEVCEGLQLARARRGSARDRDLARGPARLTVALGIDRSCDGAPVTRSDGPLQVHPRVLPVSGDAVRSGPRVGVATVHAQPWRLWLAGEPTVSVYRPAVPRRR